MIKIIGKNGLSRVIETPGNWPDMPPISKVLWIHENHKDITLGKQFDIVKGITQ